MNRGIARRSVFEDRACVRYFLSRLAREVRRGELEVHAFACMTTHYHLLLRSPRAGLSEAMRFIQNMYVRWFNRRFRRDGPLFRGRFLSRPVESLHYRRTLVRYIDRNPVSAGLVESSPDYPHGSARHFAAATGPPWLEREWVESDARERTGSRDFSARVYRSAFGAPLDPGEADLVEARIAHPSVEPDPLDDLILAAPEVVRRWMSRKAELADGTRPGLPCASPTEVHAAWTRAAGTRSDRFLPRGERSNVSSWDALLIGLLRDVAGLRWSEISARTEIAAPAARRRYRKHREWMREEEYRIAAGEVAGECLGVR